jgi:hypothetical protein
MKTNAIALLVIVTIYTVGTYSSVYARSGGPPDGRTGAPGESTCATSGCHGTSALNAGAGSLTIDAPNPYVPGTEYAVSVTLSDPVQSRWGFELTVLNADDEAAGTITLTNTNDTQFSTSGGRTYIKHTSAGTSPGTSSSRTWSFQWTAPPSDVGSITFYAAGNAANGNFSTSGDHIYISSAMSIPQTTGIGSEPVQASQPKLGPNYPNPFNPATTIPFTLHESSDVEITVYTLSGQLVSTLVHGPFAVGDHVAVWDGTNDASLRVASGVYLITMRSNHLQSALTVTLIR